MSQRAPAVARDRVVRRAAWAAVVLAAVAAPAARAAESAVVVIYHRFGEAAYPSTNITLAQFDAHIDVLKGGGYVVLPLTEIVDAIGAGRPLPERAVGLSVDDAFLSVYTQAWPRLRAAGFPFTLFVATDPIDRRMAGMMSWDKIRELAAAGVTIGGHTETHLHMVDQDPAVNAREITRATARYEAELGRRPVLFAYPYGEAGLEVQRTVRDAGYRAAFGQHSGVVATGEDTFYLPRFAMNETYGDPPRFRQAVNALPLPVRDVTPADMHVRQPNPPAIGFTVVPGIEGLDRIACYASNEGRVKIERLGGVRFEVRLAAAMPKGRSRLNCTLPAGEGRWRWWGRQFYVSP